MGNRRLSLAVSLLGSMVALVACSKKSESQALTAHKVQAVSAATKALGQGCNTGGASECLTGFCVATGLKRDQGYFCTRQCATTDDCPDRWNCVQLAPDTPGACSPPSDWVSAVAEARHAN